MLPSDYPKIQVCQVLALPRSTAYYHACSPDDQPLQTAISAVTAQYPTYGTRRVAKQLGRAPYRQLVNRKRAQRIALDLFDEAERFYMSDFSPNMCPITALKTRVWLAQGWCR